MPNRKFKVLQEPYTFLDFTEVPISREFHETIMQLDTEHLTAFFQNLRLLFRSRISSCRGDELIKLQGKIEAITEIESIVMDMLKPAKME